MKSLRWGILGTGNIASQFAAGVAVSRRGSVVAVGSRAAESANSFARPRGIASAYDSYEQLLADGSVDAVYVSLPNNLHHEWTIRAVRAGKHVLCEKPFAMDTAQAEEMFDVAQRFGLRLAEAFMYRSHPLTDSVLAAIGRGEIGTLRVVRTSFCYRTTKIDGNVRFSPELGGGALMDVGCYCINFSRLMAGEEPVSVRAEAHRHERDVDDVVVATMRFASGVLASFTCGMSPARGQHGLCKRKRRVHRNSHPLEAAPRTGDLRRRAIHSAADGSAIAHGSAAAAES